MDIKNKFPVFDKNPGLVYLDNAATTQCPEMVLETVEKYYKSKANIHRGFYSQAVEATKKYEQSRKVVAELISAKPKETIFTSGTTESLNNIARMLESDLNSEDNIVITIAEHHANFIPWQQLSDRVGCELRVVGLDDGYKIDLDSANEKIDKNTKLVSFSFVSNTLGITFPVEKLISLANEVGAYTVLDSAQAMTSKEVNVKKLGVDFLAFSGHKLFGPTGVGVMYVKEGVLEKIEPVKFGGSMVKKINKNKANWTKLPHKFEAGTPNISGALGLGKAVKFVENIRQNKIASHQRYLNKYLVNKLQEVDGIKVLRPVEKSLESGITSFVVENIHPHDIAEFLAENTICVRAGHHCAMPLMDKLGVNGTIRVSISIYNNKNDIDKLVQNIKLIQRKFY